MKWANQSILEGLNNILDYKKDLFIPELNIEIKAKNDFQIFLLKILLIKEEEENFYLKIF